MQHGKHEAAALAQQSRLLAAPVNTVRDLLEDETFARRGAFETIDHPATGPVRYAGRPFIMGESPRHEARRAPLLGEHNESVLCTELSVDPADLPRLRELGVI
ncbi:MAG: CoA transferase, partial [Dehalococcoidia bacterium]